MIDNEAYHERADEIRNGIGMDISMTTPTRKDPAEACCIPGSNDGSFDDEHDGDMFEGDEAADGDGEDDGQEAGDGRGIGGCRCNRPSGRSQAACLIDGSRYVQAVKVTWPGARKKDTVAPKYC